MLISKYTLETAKKSPYDIKWSIGYSEPLEALFSLNTLVKTEQHPYCDAWARKTFSALSKELQEEILFFSEHYAKWIFITEIVEELSIRLSPSDCSLENITEEMKKMDLVDFTYLFLGFSAFGYDEGILEGWFSSPEKLTLDDLREQKSFFKLEDVIYFLKNVDAIRERLAWTLCEYWKQSFRKTWKTLEPYLNSQISKEKDLVSACGEISYIRNMHPKIRLQDGVFIFSKAPDFSIPVKAIREIHISLSSFIGDDLAVNIIHNKLYLTKNLGFQPAIAAEALPENLLECIKSLGDDSRLRIMKILSNGQATTKDLAKILHLSSSAVSLHLKQLKNANLVDCHKENKFVYYYALPAALKELEVQFKQYLEI